MKFRPLPMDYYNNSNYGNSNIRCCSQVSVRIIYYLCITKKCNNVHGLTEIAMLADADVLSECDN